MLVIDTNVLLDAANTRSSFHARCGAWLDRMRSSNDTCFVTWPIVFEFLRTSTHPRVMRPQWTLASAWRFISVLLESDNVAILSPTDRHSLVVDDVVLELPDLAGNIMHDLHTAVLMREHGIPRICTRDIDFRRFPFVEVIDPLVT